MNPNDPKGAAGALKTPLCLIPPYAMEQTALVHKLGSDKYGPYNWRKTGVCASTYINAILRHLNAWRDGETLDPESGISHLAHVACSCNILLDADHCGTLQDDRNMKPQPVEIPAEKPEQPVETGYRFLKAGELIQEGDEYYGGASNWCNTNHHLHENYTAPYSNIYRRKDASVETEYRFLNIGEIIEEGDQYYVWGSNDWCETEHNKHCPSKVLIANFYRRKVEHVETEYRFIKEGELIQEGDEYWCCGDWRVVDYNQYGLCTVTAPNFYRRKDESKQECSCGRIKINHHTLGWICEDCEWHRHPY